jgi:hypothetical protein
MDKIKLRRTIQADHVVNVGFTESLYKKVKSTFYATLRANHLGEWVGYYETNTHDLLVRNGKVVQVVGDDPIQVMKDLHEASKCISLEISDSYVESLNHDGN